MAINPTPTPTAPVMDTDSRYLKRDAVCRRYGISRATSYKLQADGYLPAPVRLGRGVLRWSLAELEALERRAAEDRGSPKPVDAQ